MKIGLLVTFLTSVVPAFSLCSQDSRVSLLTPMLSTASHSAQPRLSRLSILASLVHHYGTAFFHSCSRRCLGSRDLRWSYFSRVGLEHTNSNRTSVTGSIPRQTSSIGVQPNQRASFRSGIAVTRLIEGKLFRRREIWQRALKARIPRLLGLTLQDL